MSPQSPSGRCRLTARRRLALGGTVLTSTLVVGLAIAAPAHADDGTVTSKDALSTAFQNGQSQIVLGAELTDPETDDSDARGTVTVPAHATVSLDLAGHSLDLGHVVLSAGSSLTVTDSTQSTDFDDDDGSRTENALVVDASSLTTGSTTAIEVGDGAHLTIARGTVRATGGDGGAGIGTAADDTTGGGTVAITDSAFVRAVGGTGGAGVGGGRGAAAADVTVSGADLRATGGDDGAGVGSGEGGTGGSLRTTNTSSGNYGYSSVIATGGEGAAGIGGGRGAAGGTVDLESNGTTTAQQGRPADSDDGVTASAIGAGTGSDAFGSLTIGQRADLELPTGSTTHLAGATVQNSGDIELGGVIDGTGTIQNDGSIDPETPYDDDQNPVHDSVQHIGGDVTILNHNYLVTLDPNGGTAGADTTVPVWDDTLDAYQYDQPTAPAGYVVSGWNTKPDGSGRRAGYLDLADATGTSSIHGEAVPITVYAQYGHPAALSSTTLPDAGLGQSYNQVIPATGDDLTDFDYPRYDDDEKPIDVLPPGLTLNPETGRLTGVPTQAGTYTFHVTVRNGYSSADGDVTIRVAGAPVFATAALPAATAGTAYSSSVQATGLGTVVYSLASGALPAGLALDPATGRIAGTPAVSGAAAFVVRATSSFGTTLQPLTLTVGAAPAAAPVVATPAAPVLVAVPRTTVRFGHRLDLAVTANSTLPLAWRVVSGALPKGVTLDPSTGVVSGVVAEVGSFSATVQATSAAGAATAVVAVHVPEVTELIHAPSAPDVKAGSGALPVKVTGLKKGERWTVLVDGEPVKHGRMKKAGTLSTSVTLAKAKHDTVHVVEIDGSRTVADPAERAATSFTITSLAARKILKTTTASSSSGVPEVVVGRLAAGEQVNVKVGRKTVAKGLADADGEFAFPRSKAGKGTHTVTVRGASAGRKGVLKVTNPKH